MTRSSMVPPSATADPGAIAASQAWTRYSSIVLRGVTHALGNRLLALTFLCREATRDGALDQEGIRSVDREVDGCAELMRRYWQLALAEQERPTPWRMSDSLADAVALFALHGDAPGREVAVTVDGDPPSVLVAPTALTQALLVVLSALTAHQPTDAVPVAEVACSEEGASVRLGAAGPAPEATVALATEAVTWLLRATRPAPRISRHATPDWTALTISLPSLDSSRRAASSAR